MAKIRHATETSVSNQMAAHNASNQSHADIRQSIANIDVSTQVNTAVSNHNASAQAHPSLDAKITVLSTNKADKNNTALTGIATLNGKELATTYKIDISLLNGFGYNNTYFYKPCSSMSGGIVCITGTLFGNDAFASTIQTGEYIIGEISQGHRPLKSVFCVCTTNSSPEKLSNVNIIPMYITTDGKIYVKITQPCQQITISVAYYV